MKTWPLLLVLTSCGQTVPLESPQLECYADVCPPYELVVKGIRLFVVEFPQFDPTRPLTVEVHPDGTVFRTWVDEAGTHEARAQTLGPDRVQIPGLEYLPHELGHVDLYRRTGDGDANHESTPGGWTAATNKAIDRVRARYAEAGVTP